MTSYLASLRQGLHDALSSDDRVYLLGEDIVDPYGGAFKVTKGLSTAFPGRVRSTPISEAAITGVAAGMALRGMRPVVEIMFGDFLTLAADQIVNHATKFREMFAEKVRVPMVIRTPMGGGRGYGATHSQSIEKMFLGTPGLQVIAPSHAHDPGELLRTAILDNEDPILFIEHKLLYPQDLLDDGSGFALQTVDDEGGWPVSLVRNRDDIPADVTVIAYGGATRHVLSVMRDLAAEEIAILAVFPSRISPLPHRPLIDAAAETGRVVVAEEGTEGFNWGAEVSALLHDRLFGRLERPVVRASSEARAIGAAAEAETSVLLGDDDLEDAIMEALQ